MEGEFQSTPSAWRETVKARYNEKHYDHFNPLPPHGGRLHKLCECGLVERISIHSLRMEGDRRYALARKSRGQGKRLPPRGRRLVHKPGHKQRELISIHSLRMEGDRRLIVLYSLRDIFQSTPSAWRETYSLILSSKLPNAFQSTPSAWRETY